MSPKKPPTPGPKSTSRRGTAPRSKAASSSGNKRSTRAGAKPRPRKAAAPKAVAPRARTRKPRGTPAVTAPATRPRRRWLRVLLIEASVVAAGIAAGLAIAGGFLWTQARHDVAAYLANPPRSAPGVLYSAPIRLHPGQQAEVADLAGDLLAAGYERVGAVDGPGQFSVAGARFEIWTEAWTGAGLDIAESRVRVRIDGGRIEADRPVELRPTVLATVGDLEGRRTDVKLAQLSPWVERAVLAMEDARFREHAGIDPLGIGRALVNNLWSAGGTQGGSTLTQQLAKNLFLSQERTLERKVREAFFAAALEAELDKDALLELYLGEVYLGQMGGVPLHGVEQASRAWFGVSASRLSLAQAATLAGVISAPNRYSPVRHPDKAQERRQLVLGRMVALGWVGEAEARAAAAVELPMHGEPPGMVRRAPWAVDQAIDDLEESIGTGSLASSGYRVHTTIDPLLQRAAERAVRVGVAELERDHPEARGAQIALVAVRVEDGAIVAMVGGRDYAESPFNRATHAWRQTGSTVKPLALLAAMDADPELSPITRVVDEPITRRVDGVSWTPSNYDGLYLGEITVREAIEHSRNIPAVKIAERVGATELQRFLRDGGLSRATYLPSASLGAFAATPLEVAGAYTVFPGGGTTRTPRLVRAVVDRHDQVQLAYGAQTHATASARSAAMVTAILEGVITDGTGRSAGSYGISGSVGGKSGTTDGFRDAWFVGFSPDLVVAVWVGHDRSQSVGVSGSRAALPTWSRFLVASGTLTGDFAQPDGIVRRPVCTDSGRLARPSCPSIYTETFSDETDPGARCDLHGGPLVEVGSMFQGLFGRSPETIEDGIPDVVDGDGEPVDVDDRKRRRRRRRD